MSRWLRDVRLIPIVLIAVGCLFALKAAGLWIGGGYTLSQRLWRGETITVTSIPATASTPLQSPTVPLDVAAARPGPKRSWAQEMFNYPDVTGSVARSTPQETVTFTGSSAKEPAKEQGKEQPDKKDAKPAKPDAPQAKPAADKSPSDKSAGKPADMAARPTAVSTAERAVLERLLERRQELEAKARELELRETLLKAAEKNLEEKLAAFKKDGPNQRKDETEAARFKSLVTMYETMKPKEAAKIFDRLDIKVLMDVAGQMNPRRVSEIMALMSAEAAERLTIEFAARSDGDKSQKPADLPKIDGKPSGG